MSKTQPKYFILFALFFSTCLLLSNLTAQKLVGVAGISFTAGTIYFPLMYIMDNVVTEVYGFERSRQLIWLGLASNILLVLGLGFSIVLPAASGWHGQEAYASILGAIPRIVLASFVAYFCGEFFSSFCLAKLKIAWQGKQMGIRFALASGMGLAIDSILFIGIAFAGILPIKLLLITAFVEYLLKVFYVVVSAPFVTLFAQQLKQIEAMDVYDRKTNFNPFKLNNA